MASPNGRQRAARISLYLIAGLLVLFGAFTGYHIWMHFRSTSDAALLAELHDATIIEASLPEGPSDWPQWRGPRRDGVSPEKDLLIDWPASGPKVLWKADCGEGFSSITVSGGRAITLFQNADRSAEIVICWDAETGKELWQREYASSYVNGFGSGPRSTPTIDEDRVYTVGGTGVFHCLEAATGKVVWKHELLKEFNAANIQWGVSFSPFIEGGLVLTNPGGRHGDSLAAFDKRTGELRWQTLDDRAGYSSPIAITAGGVRQIVFFTGDGAVGVAPTDGRLLWRKPWKTSNDVNAATPISFQTKAGDQVGDYLFISSDYGKGCALLKLVKSGDQFTAQSVYETNQMCNHFSTSVRHQDNLYGFNDAVLTCMDVRTGDVRWVRKDSPRNVFAKGSLILVDGKLIILGETGQLALAEATPEEYKELARTKVFDGVKKWAPPVLARGKLYLRDETEVKCLDLRKDSQQ
jgi:outer membrane protein assembly factor BamB